MEELLLRIIFILFVVMYIVVIFLKKKQKYYSKKDWIMILIFAALPQIYLWGQRYNISIILLWIFIIIPLFFVGRYLYKKLLTNSRE